MSELLISDEEFLLFQRLIYKVSGIYLSDSKKVLLIARLAKRLQELQLESFLKYYRFLMTNEHELEYLFNRISTNETKFFREPIQFEFLQNQIFPLWKTEAMAGKRAKNISVWSAGCSTGEEPYSLAMTLLDNFPSTSGWKVSILATDLSTSVLEKAQQGLWSIEKARDIPEHYLKHFMLKGVNSQEGVMKAGKEIQSIIKFQYLNLNNSIYDIASNFDLILCRNVLIYFNSESRMHVINQLLKHLSPTGYFFLGHSESLQNIPDRVQSVIPTIYTAIIKETLSRKAKW